MAPGLPRRGRLGGRRRPRLLPRPRARRAGDGPTTPADASLRDRIRQAICEATGFEWDPDWQEVDEYGEQADAILAVLPASADRAATLAWGEGLSARGAGDDLHVSIDVLLPDGQTAEVTLDRAAATMLHAQLGDALGLPPARADRAAVLTEAADFFDARAVSRMFGHQVAAELRRMTDEVPGGDR